ncbi:hypothetical protein JDV02_006397 [Purpureocillium takamizusanense]|uniref:Uncharacterized protein n=1 Tax=Purpureocillium takamizusanense TaxID=2060973 RepID=A0A9Q8VCY7_9HYPO|nr:uncharacterized protein JDV02_006397 [Purpureocillium takamizusanense]UNI20297.1 hypothetical protein JDV02_006397 [Purpureocillium takamizusanense]
MIHLTSLKRNRARCSHPSDRCPHGNCAVRGPHGSDNCVEDGCRSQRRWFGGRDMRRCDEHRCHLHNCTEARGRSDYCRNHTCRSEGCREGVISGASLYCVRHEGLFSGNGVGGGVGSGWACDFDACEHRALSGHQYCNIHECEVRECLGPIVAGVANFCFEHKCRVCSHRKLASGRFCLEHGCAHMDCGERAVNSGWCDAHWNRRRRRRRRRSSWSRSPGVRFEDTIDDHDDDEELDDLDYDDDEYDLDDDDDDEDGHGRWRPRSRVRGAAERSGSPARACHFRTGSGPIPDRICSRRAERDCDYCTQHRCRDRNCDGPVRGETSLYCRGHECERDGCQRRVHRGRGAAACGSVSVCARHRRCVVDGCGRDVDGRGIDALCVRHRFLGAPFRGSGGLA